jgi:hypothetical protein
MGQRVQHCGNSPSASTDVSRCSLFSDYKHTVGRAVPGVDKRSRVAAHRF